MVGSISDGSIFRLYGFSIMAFLSIVSKQRLIFGDINLRQSQNEEKFKVLTIELL